MSAAALWKSQGIVDIASCPCSRVKKASPLASARSVRDVATVRRPRVRPPKPAAGRKRSRSQARRTRSEGERECVRETYLDQRSGGSIECSVPCDDTKGRKKRKNEYVASSVSRAKGPTKRRPHFLPFVASLFRSLQHIIDRKCTEQS